jgi:hypothetical protein
MKGFDLEPSKTEIMLPKMAFSGKMSLLPGTKILEAWEFKFTGKYSRR